MGIHDRPYYRDETPSGLSPSWNNKSPVAVIIILNAIFFFANMIFGGRDDQITNWMALRSTDFYQPWQWWRTLTFGFAHDANIGHVFFNMLGLWFLGRTVEDRYGWNEFWRIYLIAIVVGGFAFLFTHLAIGSNALVVGASGAVICIEMLFVLNFPQTELMFFGIVPIKAWLLGVGLIASNFFPAAAGVVSHTSYTVHIAGILFAAAYFYWGWNFGFMENLAHSSRRMKRKAFGPKLKAYKPDVEEADAARADAILDKIHRTGQQSLTRNERRFLENYSKSVRERNQSLR